MGRTQHLYSCRFWMGEIPQDEFPNNFMYLTIEIDVLMECEFSVEEESQVFSGIFRTKNRAA